MIQRNFVWAALIPYIPYAIMTVAAGGGVLWAYLRGSEAARQRELQIQQQAELNRQQAYASQIQSQMMIERFTPVAWATVPIMLLVGGYFIWKSRQETDRE